MSFLDKLNSVFDFIVPRAHARPAETPKPKFKSTAPACTVIKDDKTPGYSTRTQCTNSYAIFLDPHQDIKETLPGGQQEYISFKAVLDSMGKTYDDLPSVTWKDLANSQLYKGLTPDQKANIAAWLEKFNKDNFSIKRPYDALSLGERISYRLYQVFGNHLGSVPTWKLNLVGYAIMEEAPAPPPPPTPPPPPPEVKPEVKPEIKPPKPARERKPKPSSAPPDTQPKTQPKTDYNPVLQQNK